MCYILFLGVTLKGRALRCNSSALRLCGIYAAIPHAAALWKAGIPKERSIVNLILFNFYETAKVGIITIYTNEHFINYCQFFLNGKPKKITNN